MSHDPARAAELHAWSRWLWSGPPPVVCLPLESGALRSLLGFAPSAASWALMLDKIPGLRGCGHAAPGSDGLMTYYRLADVERVIQSVGLV